jgi:hypothetical protein
MTNIQAVHGHLEVGKLASGVFDKHPNKTWPQLHLLLAYWPPPAGLYGRGILSMQKTSLVSVLLLPTALHCIQREESAKSYMPSQ